MFVRLKIDGQGRRLWTCSRRNSRDDLVNTLYEFVVHSFFGRYFIREGILLSTRIRHDNVHHFLPNPGKKIFIFIIEKSYIHASE